MDVNKILNRDYSLQTLLLCTPYVKKDDRDLNGLLSEEDFMDYFYVDAVYDERITQIKEEIKKTNKVLEVSRLKNQIKMIESKKKKVIEFENNIITTRDSEEIGYIVGCSGSGKTTYLHHLLFKKNINHVVFDLNKITGEIILLQSIVDISEIGVNNITSENTMYKLIRVIFDQINELLCIDHLKYKKNWNKENKYKHYCQYLLSICENFYSRFDKEDKNSILHQYYGEIINCFRNYHVYENREQQIKEHKDFTNKVISEFLSNAKKYCDKSNNTYKENSLAIFCLRLIILICVCIVDTDSYLAGNYKYIISFDNIEYYINEDAIYDEDILQIEKVLQELVGNIEKFFVEAIEEKSEKEIYRSHFKIIMLVRDSTNFLDGMRKSSFQATRQEEDYDKSYIDITDMYALNEIYQNRYQKLSELNLLSKFNKDTCAVLQQIITDNTIYDNSSAKMLDDMYNHNKRRITLYLLQILTLDVKKEYGRLRELSDFFANKGEFIAANALKSAARSMILRELFNKIEETKYFDALLAIGNSDEKNERRMGSGLARKILTFLWKNEIKFADRRNSDKKDYVSFYELVQNILISPNANYDIVDYKINEVAQVIMKMNDPSRDNTAWCQLVLIRFKRKKFDTNNLVKELKRAYEQKDNDIQDFGIRITSAGISLLKNMGLFEYFACRYVQDSDPLFHTNNIIPLGKSLPCKNLITKIKNRTINCIKQMKQTDDIFFSGFNSPVNYMMMHRICDYGDDYEQEKWNVHAVHIIAKQIGYLENFRCYLCKCYEYDKISLSSDEVKDLSKFILNAMLEYISVYDSLYNCCDNNGVYYINHLNEYDNILKLRKNIEIEKSNIDKSDSSMYMSIYR